VLDAVRRAAADLLRTDRITASDAALADLPSVVLPLAAPDLPVIVWSRSARLFEMPPFSAIAR